MKLSAKTVLPLVITFVLLAILLILSSFLLPDKGIRFEVVHGGNLLFFGISLLVFRMQFNAMHNKNPQVFIRSVMGGTLIKVFACLVAVVAYYFISGPAFNKPAVYISMIIYLVYLIVEVRTIMNLNKSKNA